MKAEYPFNLYMMAPPRREPIDVTQNDNLMVELVAKLKNRNGTAFLPPEGAVANFIAVKPDGHGIVLRSDDPEEPKVTLADDEVRVSLPREALAVTGWIACKIAIQDNDAIASSQEFSLMCNRDLLPEDFAESEAYQSIIYYLEHLGEREAEFDDMKEQFYQAINGLTEDDEVINARIDGPYSTTYDTLKLRLDAMSALLKGVVDGDFENRVSDLEDEVEDARGEFDALVDRLDDTDGRIADNAGEIDSAKVKILQLEQENKQLKKIVEDSNPTQSPRVTSTGYGVISLPPNAANGQISVTAKGLTATNLVRNGDFRNGTSGWTAGGCTLSADNGVLRITATGATEAPSVSRNLFTKRRGQKLYVRVKAKVTNSECQYIRLYVGLNSVYQYTPEVNKEYLISGVLTMPIDDTNIWYAVFHGYENAEVATGKVMEIREAMTVDLTAMFGAGNEPSKEECDKMFSRYIDGIKSTISAFRIRSVSEDESQESVVYVLAKDDEGNIEELRSLPNGTKDEINVSEGKLIQRIGLDYSDVDNPTFTRNSVAYLSDGTQVAANQPRFEDGPFAGEKAIMIEERTTNLFPADRRWAFNAEWTSDTLNGTYTVSIHGGTGKLVLSGGATGEVVAGQSLTFSVSDATVTFTPVDGTPERCQLEQKGYGGYATSFVDGTRAGENLLIQNNGILNPQEGTIECWAWFPTFQQMHGYSLLRTAPSVNGKHLDFGLGNYRLHLTFWDTQGTAQYLFGRNGSVYSNNWHYYVIKWGSFGTKVIVDDYTEINTKLQIHPDALSTQYVRLGSYDGVYSFMNGFIADLRISSIARTDEEILATYQSRQPLSVDAYTTYKLNFDGDLTAQRAKPLIYQLATPIEIPIQTSGSLVSYPSGTVYIEPFVADAGIYTDKMSVLHQDLPIKVLEKISKVDFETGVETELDPAQAVIAADKLSFTHPDLEAGDIVFFVYEYDRESTVGETEIEYYDSRYVIKDSVTGKFYKWHIAVAEGVPSIELVEV